MDRPATVLHQCFSDFSTKVTPEMEDGESDVLEDLGGEVGTHKQPPQDEHVFEIAHFFLEMHVNLSLSLYIDIYFNIWIIS